MARLFPAHLATPRLQPRQPPPAIDDELACLEGLLPDVVLAQARSRAAVIGTGADRVLIANGDISELDFLTRFAAHSGIPFAGLDALPRSACPLSDERLVDAAAAGLLPVEEGGQLHIVMAPLQIGARRLAGLARGGAGGTIRFRVTTNAMMAHFITRHASQALTKRAADALSKASPDYSAAPHAAHKLSFKRYWATAALLLMIAGAAVTHPRDALMAVDIGLAAVFAFWIALRLFGACVPVAPAPAAARRSEASLPVYTIIAALYHEAGAVKGLVSALRRLDYPGIMAQTPQA